MYNAIRIVIGRCFFMDVKLFIIQPLRYHKHGFPFFQANIVEISTAFDMKKDYFPSTCCIIWADM